MSFALPIPEIRTVIALAMATAWGVGQAQGRTKYPDQRPLQDLLSSKDGIGEADGLNEQYFVITPGITQSPQVDTTCEKNNFPLPVRIYICRRVQDTPHDDGATMLARAASLANVLWALTVPWTGVTEMADRHLVRMTTEFPEADDINRAHFASVLLEIAIDMEITP